MRLEAVLKLLEDVKGPSDFEVYTARCPAHQDNSAGELHLLCKHEPDGETVKIYAHCTAGCTQDQILQALERKMLGGA